MVLGHSWDFHLFKHMVCWVQCYLTNNCKCCVPTHRQPDILSFNLQYYRIIEIGIRQCRSSGIDCKIHGLSVVARVRSDDDYIPTTFSILAQDKEGEDEEEGSGHGSSSRSGGHSNILRSKKGKGGAGKDIQTYVFVWGLNDKDQLGGPKGSKV